MSDNAYYVNFLIIKPSALQVVQALLRGLVNGFYLSPALLENAEVIFSLPDFLIPLRSGTGIQNQAKLPSSSRAILTIENIGERTCRYYYATR